MHVGLVFYRPCLLVSALWMGFGIYAPLPHDNKRRMRSKDRDVKSDGVDEEWTEYVSNSRIRIFFYNKKLDVKQWEKHKGMVKK